MTCLTLELPLDILQFSNGLYAGFADIVAMRKLSGRGARAQLVVQNILQVVRQGRRWAERGVGGVRLDLLAGEIGILLMRILDSQCFRRARWPAGLF